MVYRRRKCPTSGSQIFGSVFTEYKSRNHKLTYVNNNIRKQLTHSVGKQQAPFEHSYLRKAYLQNLNPI